MISKRSVVTQLLLPPLLISIIAAPLHLGAENPALTQDQGYVALQQELQRLRTTARLMHTTAHPDDEDGGMLTLESRGKGATALLCSLTRGQGGQNKSGDAFSDELGVLRTLELLAATHYYGVDLRFTRVADFGFSKTPEETFQKWGGHEIAMADLVRVIRTFRPDVLIARFTGTTRDGHAHHQASSMVTQEAFRAAGDPNRFPEQIKEGLLPWQPRKLYIGHFGSSEDANLRFDIGSYSSLLGMSYTQLAVEGLAHQTSQGTGGFRVPPGHRYTYYTRVDSTLPKVELKNDESDFLDGIDTTLPGLAARLGADESKVSFLRPALQQMAKLVEEAAQKAQPREPSQAGAPLIQGLNIAREVIKQVEQSNLSPAEKIELLTNLRTKQTQFERAANLALGVLLELSVDPPEGPQSGFFRFEQTFQTAVPGQTFTLSARFYDRGTKDVEPQEIALDMPEGFKAEIVKSDLKLL
ncbi:MAG TPA: PIG-L family deacetylase, partial [Terriglobales bacterium]|nr:PIG-L family deacetylase [Terriglobales bacterium]